MAAFGRVVVLRGSRHHLKAGADFEMLLHLAAEADGNQDAARHCCRCLCLLNDRLGPVHIAGAVIVANLLQLDDGEETPGCHDFLR
jgi:hypothetical protein